MTIIIAIAGSPSHPSRSSAVLEYAKTVLASEGLPIDLITVRDLPAEDLLFANFDSVAIRKAQALVEKADGVIIATPVYKASYTGVLKSFLDLLPPGAFSGKVILPIATGGTLAHLLAIDYALKPVIATLGARYVLGGVYLLDTQIQTNPDGSVHLEAEIEQRLKASLYDFVDGIQQVKNHQLAQSKKEPALAPLE
ncbi:MAG: NADPH-dependent FMN reductase [Symplocastrum torsivum CPER-KK1]|jgi:FMN reductase|uniref:NADPH-dependent FMN reductase n=1 Tax=Symplocastrum torsivum CPER-KK1 TaxID=450513 RepID=A0A951PNQ2_9CYAN|nr:NADPH-dependent FMN reductase [Symplocastrum torsivum CPER-KK1]